MASRDGVVWAAVLLVASVSGCVSPAPDVKASDPAKAQAALNDGQSRVYAVPARQLVEKLKVVLPSAPVSLPVAQADGNKLTTDWREYPGEYHIARRWQERTRFVITVLPDWERPTEASRLQVAVETQQRHSPKVEWYDAPHLQRAQRATALLEELSSRLVE